MARILVCDDDDQILGVVSRILESAQHEAATAADTPEARALLAEREPDVLLCDVNLPSQSGLSFVREVSDRHPDVAVVMLTGLDDPGVASEAMEAGAYGYIVKPFNRNMMLITIAHALRRRELEIGSRAHVENLDEMLRARTAHLWRALQVAEFAEGQTRDLFEDLLVRLSLAAELRDQGTGDHVARVGRYSEILAAQLGLDSETARTIGLAARMHDLGKIAVPDAVLRRRGPLRDSDWQSMRQHPRIGHDILRGSASPLLDTAASIALTHHERWDGAGYPTGLSGEAIPIEGRVTAVADVFDAITSNRPYRRAMGIAEAVATMKEAAGSHLDPSIVAALLQSLGDILDITLGSNAAMQA